MKISSQTQQFLMSHVDKNQNGTTYEELQTLDQDRDGKIDAAVQDKINPEDKTTIETVLKETQVATSKGKELHRRHSITYC